MKRKRSHFKCAICGKEYEYAILSGVNKHIKLCHGLTAEEYYEKYCESAPTCMECGKRARFLDIRRGFDSFCSKICKQRYSAKNMSSEVREAKIAKWKQALFGTEEKKQLFQEKVKTGVEKYFNSLTDEEKAKRKEMCAFYAKKEWEEKSDEEKQAFIDHTRELFLDDDYRKRFSEKTSIGTRKAYENMDKNKRIEMLKKRSCTRRSLFYNTFLDNLQKYTQLELLDSKEEYINNEEHLYHCKKCNLDFNSTGINIQTAICPNCKGHGCVSGKEKDVVRYIQSVYEGTIIENDRKVLYPKELDIYIPKKNLAIEFNGIYWHSDAYLHNRFYHQEKTLACREKGIRLIHIFENEWMFKQDICQSIINAALGIYKLKLNARSCIIKPLNSIDYRNFLIKNHLQGAINSPIRYGLFYMNELVAVIGFGKSRFKKDEVELHRFCSKLGYNIRGAFSKLIKHSNVEDFITYVDLAHFSGSGYAEVGFDEIGITEPNYKWIKDSLSLNRFSTQKHKLQHILGNQFNPELSESENMSINGFYKIYDSGNLKLLHSTSKLVSTF